MSDSYTKLLLLSKQTALLASTQRLLEWDQETYLPQGAIEIRSLQLETLAHLIHKSSTSRRFAKALERLISIETGHIHNDQLSPQQAAALREWRRDYLKAIKLPASFVKKFAETTSKALHIWAEARRTNNFKLFLPLLEKIISLSRKKADYLGFEEHPYDALLDLFEPGMTSSYLTPLFHQLQMGLRDLLNRIPSKPRGEEGLLKGPFPPSQQIHFAQDLLKAMGLNPLYSRLDQSTHPFCTDFHPKDVRLTTTTHTESPLLSIFSTIHEGGHALYHKNLPEEHYGSPLCEAVSFGVDESQSRFWETFIGHSLCFWTHFYPKLQRAFPEQLERLSLEEFYRVINRVEPSLIRIESDEVSYSLHIILRFELEKSLIEGSLKAKDLPEAWNEKMQTYLGVVVPNDRLGCLQDIHWSMGAIGYFPSYALGNLYAAQLFATFEKAYPSWREEVSKGELLFIERWLCEKIHRYGRQFTPKELIFRSTHSPLQIEPYLTHLNERYSLENFFRT
jgi:carboxypeptidase Taq